MRLGFPIMLHKRLLLNQILFISVLLCRATSGNSQDCYQSYIKTEVTHLVKPIGKFKNQLLYREIFSFNNGSGTSLNIILLRKDTSFINDFDICFDIEGGLKIDVSKIEQNDDSDTVYSLKDIKTISQLLYGGLNFGRLDNEDTKLYLKNNVLYLTYYEGDCISECPYCKVTETYKDKSGSFQFVKRSRRKMGK